MGYRSNIALAMSKKVKNEFYRKLASEKVNNETRKEVKSLFESATQHLTDPDTGAEVWYWSDLKWYQGYSDVDFIEGVLSELNDDEFYFVRVGEDYEDNDIRGWWSDNPFGITFCTEIVFDC